MQIRLFFLLSFKETVEIKTRNTEKEKCTKKKSSLHNVCIYATGRPDMKASSIKILNTEGICLYQFKDPVNFYSYFPVFIVHLLLHAKYTLKSFQFEVFLY